MIIDKASLHPIQESMLPKGWELLPVGKVLIDSQYGTNAPAVDNGDTAVVGMKDIQDGRVLTSGLGRADLSGNERSKYILEAGDILINRTNSYDLVGKVGIYDSTVEAAFASYLVRLKVNINKVIPEYLNYWLNGYVAQKTIKRIATRAVSQANVNPTEFKKHCYIPLPSLGEQKIIVSVLQASDQAIYKTSQLISAKEERLRWLTLELISGKKRLSSYKNNWKKVTFGKLFTPHKVLNIDSQNIEVLSVTKKGIVRQGEYFNKDVASQDKSNYLVVERGELVLSGLNFWMGSIDFQQICDKGIVSPAYKVFRTNNNYSDDSYLRFYVRSSFMTRILIRSSVQGASIVRRNLDMAELNESQISLPPIKEQKAIASILLAAEKELLLLREQFELYKALKRGLMQKLLMGQWYIKNNKEVV